MVLPYWQQQRDLRRLRNHKRAQIPGSGEAPPRQQNKKAVVKRTPAKDKSDTPYETQYYRRDHKIGLRKMYGDKKQVFQFGVPSSIEEQLKKLDDAARNMLECGFDLKSVKDAVHQAVAKIKADKKAVVKRTPAKDESVSEATTRGCGSQDVDRRFYGKRLPKESQAKVVSEKYQPNSRIQNLPHVEFRPTEPIVLRCSHCHHEVTSCWYFAHPKSSRVAVIVPNRGHAACTRLKGRVVSYEAVCGTPSKSDVFSIMDFCTHHILRRRCANCGGEDLCERSKRRDSCTVCECVNNKVNSNNRNS